LRLFRETAHILGAELFVAQQATLIAPGLAAQDRRRVAYRNHGFGYEAHVKAFALMNQVIEEEIPPDHIVPLRLLSGRPDLFHDHVHPTIAGAKAMATLAAEVLARSATLTGHSSSQHPHEPAT
jgi:hypothetical protein